MTHNEILIIINNIITVKESYKNNHSIFTVLNKHQNLNLKCIYIYK